MTPHHFDPMPNRRCSACGRFGSDPSHAAYQRAQAIRAFAPMVMTRREKLALERALNAFRWAEPPGDPL